MYSKNRKTSILYFLLFIAFLGGLVITQSRGYWISLLIALTVFFYYSEFHIKKKLLKLASISLIPVCAIVLLYFSKEFKIVFVGLFERLYSFDIFNLDASLQERVLETHTILQKIIQNPIAGYGLGITYDRYYMVYETFITTNYIHNGYLSVWFKLGIIGLAIFITIYLITFKKSILIYYQSESNYIRAVALTIISCVFSMLILNISSPQFYAFDSVLYITLFAVFVTDEYQKIPIHNN